MFADDLKRDIHERRERGEISEEEAAEALRKLMSLNDRAAQPYETRG